MLIIHKKGTIINNPAISIKIVTESLTGRFLLVSIIRLAPLLVMDPAFLADPLDDRNDKNKGEQEPRYRGRITHLIVTKGCFVDEQR
ncbi:hypothetical protein D3C84_927340 [compost metagenome]